MAREAVTLSTLFAGPLPAVLQASLLMSAISTHIQICHSFNFLSYTADRSDYQYGTRKVNDNFLLPLSTESFVICDLNTKWKWWLFILPAPHLTVCTKDSNDPRIPLPGSLSPMNASKSSFSRCSLLLLTANEIYSLLVHSSFCCSLWSVLLPPWHHNKLFNCGQCPH